MVLGGVLGARFALRRSSRRSPEDFRFFIPAHQAKPHAVWRGSSVPHVEWLRLVRLHPLRCLTPCTHPFFTFSFDGLGVTHLLVTPSTSHWVAFIFALLTRASPCVG